MLATLPFLSHPAGGECVDHHTRTHTFLMRGSTHNVDQHTHTHACPHAPAATHITHLHICKANAHSLVPGTMVLIISFHGAEVNLSCCSFSFFPSPILYLSGHVRYSIDRSCTFVWHLDPGWYFEHRIQDRVVKHTFRRWSKEARIPLCLVFYHGLHGFDAQLFNNQVPTTINTTPIHHRARSTC